MLISVCSFPLVSTSSHHDNRKSQCWPRTLALLGLYEILQRRHIVSKEKPFQKNTRLFLILNVSIGPGCAMKILSTSGCRAHVVQAGCRWRKKMKNILLAVVYFVFFSQVGLGDNRTFLHDWFESPPELRWPLDLDWVDWGCWTYGIKHGKKGFV